MKSKRQHHIFIKLSRMCTMTLEGRKWRHLLNQYEITSMLSPVAINLGTTTSVKFYLQIFLTFFPNIWLSFVFFEFKLIKIMCLERWHWRLKVKLMIKWSHLTVDNGSVVSWERQKSSLNWHYSFFMNSTQQFKESKPIKAKL